jgi:hypothetical protein
MLGTVEVGKEIRLRVLLVGKYETWYSIEGPHYMEVAVNDMLFAGSVITF